MRIPNRQVLIEELQEQLQSWERGPPRRAGDVCPTGCAKLDRLLPEGGLRRGTLVEWLAVTRGGAAGMLAMCAAREAAREGGAIVLFDRSRLIYPPALAAWNIELPQVIVVTAANAADECWAIDQALRCSGVAAVWAALDKLEGRMFRRWQLAAETSGVLGLLVRPETARREPTWSDVRWEVVPRSTAQGRRWHVELIRCRGGRAGAAVEVIFDEATGALSAAHDGHETHPLHLVSERA